MRLESLQCRQAGRRAPPALCCRPGGGASRRPPGWLWRVPARPAGCQRGAAPAPRPAPSTSVCCVSCLRRLCGRSRAAPADQPRAGWGADGSEARLGLDPRLQLGRWQLPASAWGAAQCSSRLRAGAQCSSRLRAGWLAAAAVAGGGARGGLECAGAGRACCCCCGRASLTAASPAPIQPLKMQRRSVFGGRR